MVADRSSSSTARPRTGHRVAGIAPVYWLALAVALYFAVSVVLSWVRALDLTTTTWDLGIYQQALWSTAHGRPFWEAADAETGGYGSFLQVHSAFVLYLLVPLYAAVPSAVTLFVVQSAAVALAALPLFALGRDQTGSSRWGLAAAVVYLAWTPVLAANLYDFHVEAFLPLELFSFVLLWSRGRYLAGAAVAALACATIELAPVLLFFAGLFFLLPGRAEWRAALARRGPAGGVRSLGRFLPAELRRALHDRRVVATLALLAGTVGAYLFLLLLREQLLSAWFGFPAFPSTSHGYVVGATAPTLGLAGGNLFVGLSTKLVAWLILLALLGFIPLLAPRALLLAAPWFVFTLFSANLDYVTIGFQYGFIVAASLLVAFTYGLVPIDRWLRQHRPARSPGVGLPAGHGGNRRRWLPPAVRSYPPTLVALGLIALVAVNVAVSPANPLVDRLGEGAAYQITIPPAPGFADAEAVAGLVPAGAE
ncbi:MAG: DUF2079 domain-containing protein, partial [Thermoplasmata archaeon]